MNEPLISQEMFSCTKAKAVKGALLVRVVVFPDVILVTPREKGNSPVLPLFGLIGVLIKVIKRKKERETFASMSFEDLNKVAIDRIKIDEIETARVVPGFGPSQALEIVSNQRTSFLRNDPKHMQSLTAVLQPLLGTRVLLASI
jgi:hypothetical protein